MRVARTILAVTVALLLALPALAQEKPRKGGARGGMRPLAMQLRMLESLNLSAEQKTKLQALEKELSPKMEETMKGRMGILTEEQGRTFFSAMREARQAGKSNKEAMEAAYTEAKVTDEQKAKLAEAEKKMAELRQTFNEKVQELLTPEQRDQLKQKFEEMRKKMGPKKDR